jgi:serine/threonine protein kinase
MVWEYIAGVTLEEWMLRHGPLPAAQALDIARQVLSGLSEIHAQGIVHRDLSPTTSSSRENRRAPPRQDHRSRDRQARDGGDPLDDGTGLFVGKLKYCSPEQAGALPAGQVVDGRSDLYSFGVVLYEMLSGSPPFESQTPEGYLGQHLNRPPPPLDKARLPARTGPALSAIVLRALEKNRDRRFSSAREFAAALERADPAVTESLLRPRRGMRSLVETARCRTSWSSCSPAGAVAAALYILNRPGSRRPIPRPSPRIPPSAEPTAVPTAGPDEVVIAPGSWNRGLRPLPPRPRRRRRPCCP